MSQLWRIQLFEGPRLLTAEGVALHRFRSQRVGALLAYLALNLDRACPREELAEALWPEEDPTLTANRLRVTLASLRKQLEPPGVPFGTVLDVSQARRVRLRADAAWCDTWALERALKAGDYARATALASGSLLPDYYDSWVIVWREGFAAQTENLPYTSPAITPPTSVPEHAVSLGGLPSRVPRYLTRFFGRESELHHLVALLQQAPLVSLVGPGGIGKSRLAVEAAAGQSRPVVFIALADLSDASHLTDTLLEALTSGGNTGSDPFERVVALLSASPTLLILDNVEPFVESVSVLVLRLIATIPSLQILVTSRQRLEIPGEAVLLLLPFETPSLAAHPERLTEFPAVALFVDRARNSLPDFVLAPRHADALVEICQRLEGIPLAIELAAARVTVQTPAQIATSLAQNLTELKSRQRGLPERHRSLRAVVLGSLELLSPELRQFFAQLSIFRGGWTAEAAVAVTGHAAAEALLEELVMRSLVVAQEESLYGPMRYRFLELLRHFAQETLPAGEIPALAQRHADYFLLCAAYVSGAERGTLEPLDGEGENLLVALAWGAQNPSESFWLGLRGTLVHSQVRGLHRQLQGWSKRIADGSLEVPKSLIGFQIRNVTARILSSMGCFAESRQLSLSDRLDAAQAGFPVLAVYATTLLGFIATETGEPLEGLVLLREALEQAETLHNPALENECCFLVARALLVCARDSVLTEAQRGDMLRESEALLRSLPTSSVNESLVSLGLAVSLLYQGRREESRSFLKKARKLAERLQESSTLLYCLSYESHHALLEGDLERAALLLGAYASLRERSGNVAPSSPAESTAAILRERLSQETFEHLLLRGRQTPLDEIFDTEFALHAPANT